MVFSNYYIFLLCLIYSSASVIIDDIKDKFGNNPCIIGYVIHSDGATKVLTKDIEEHNQYQSLVDVISDKEAKSILSQLHELADYNKVEYTYTLKNTKGPAHDRIFTISLKLGDEEYESHGRSFKEAKRLVAILALKNTEFERPPEKQKNVNANDLTPTVLLNNIANKLGLKVSYEFMDSVISHVEPSNDEKPKRIYLQKLNDSIHSKDSLKKYQDLPDSGPFHVLLTVDKNQFFASAHTKQEAKHKAASHALEILKQMSVEKQSVCYANPLSKECKDRKDHLKNPISLIYEAAQIRNLEVLFEVIAEAGPAHAKEYTTQCTVGEFATQGIGSSKKESKRVAAQMMLMNLPYFPEVQVANQIVSSLKTKKKNKKRKKSKIQEESGNIASFVTGIMDTVFGSDENTNDAKNNENEIDVKKQKPKSSGSKSSQSLLLELSNRNKFEVNFVEVGEQNGKYFSLAVLHKVPTYMCLGEAENFNLSKELAADLALKLLFKQGLIGDLTETESVIDEGECPEESVSIIVNTNEVNMK